MTLLPLLFAALLAPAELHSLHWQGVARIYAAKGRMIDVEVSTRVTPFQSARSDTQLVGEGEASRRSLIIDKDGGWIEREGRRDPMPPAMLAHERQQYAIYGLMQQAMVQAAPNAVVTLKGPPETEFRFDAAGRLAEARNRVANHEAAGGEMEQLFVFSGDLASNGLHWPRQIEILQDGQPYFTLILNRFEATTP